MYGRDYAGKTLNFEASGGLTNASLIMQDQQTDTYWSIMKGAAVAGKLDGQPLQELPLGEKMSWREWRTKHPATKVLSVNNQEDGRNSYAHYLHDKNGFRGLRAQDKRLKTKAPIFAFHWEKEPRSVRHNDLVGGATFSLANGELFLYRKSSDKITRSTTAFFSKTGFVKKKRKWTELGSDTEFDLANRNFADGEIDGIKRVTGFDTYWYNWSLNNPETSILQPNNPNE